MRQGYPSCPFPPYNLENVNRKQRQAAIRRQSINDQVGMTGRKSMLRRLFHREVRKIAVKAMLAAAREKLKNAPEMKPASMPWR